MGCGASTAADDHHQGAGGGPGPLHGGPNDVKTLNPGYAGEYLPGTAAASSAPLARATFAASYVRGAKLGKGNYATVYKVSPKGNHSKVYAAKVIKKAPLTPEDMAALAIEVKAMGMLKQHPNFVHIVESLSERCGASSAPARALAHLYAPAPLTPLPCHLFLAPTPLQGLLLHCAGAH
jgi:serine/threonine protein kinase